MGIILEKDYPEKFEEALIGVPPPPEQRAFRVSSMRMEQINNGGGWYEEGEARERTWKCTEW